MKLKSFQIKSELLLSDKGKKSYKFSCAKKSLNTFFFVPKNQVISFKEDYEWVSLSVTDWLWNKAEMINEIDLLKKEEKAYMESETHFEINWDYVIRKKLQKNNCFFCHRKLYRGHRTKDHLVAKAILGAYGYDNLPNNLVPCCLECNQIKANLHPKIFKELIKRKLHETGGEYYRIILDTLNRLLIEEK